MKYLFIALMLSVLSGCASLKNNIGNILGGASAIATAPAAQQAIANCVADDLAAQEALKGPADFFGTGYQVITERGADVPVITLVNEFPDYYEQIPDQWAAVWTALEGKDCGPVVAQFKANGEAAYAGLKKAVAASDKFAKACEIYATFGPVASMFSPVPIPSRIPGCS